MILAIEKRELGLNEEFLATDAAVSQFVRNVPSDAFFEVLLTLIGGVQTAKSGGQRIEYEALGRFLLPGCSVKKARHANASCIDPEHVGAEPRTKQSAP